jgi:two-component system chemotaxis response regulator CheY
MFDSILTRVFGGSRCRLKWTLFSTNDTGIGIGIGIGARAEPTMSNSSINLRGLTFLIADQNAYLSSICNSILRGFGATKVIEVRNGDDAIKALTAYKIDLLLCDAKVPPTDGLQFARLVRWNKESEFRTLPILIMTNDTRSAMIAKARDCGANMVVAKPLSPASLYDRLAWIAFNPRRFIDSPNYFGPDRRFKIEGYPNGIGRRKGDKAAEIGEVTGPALSQSDIDKLLKTARDG